MIPRYTLPEMEKIWSDEQRFGFWLEIEILACEALSELGKVPSSAVENIRRKAQSSMSSGCWRSRKRSSTM